MSAEAPAAPPREGPPSPRLDAIPTGAGPVPRVACTLGTADLLGTLRVRLGMGRMAYAVEPGLYAVGDPTPASPVLVTANYKLSFDALRSSLVAVDAWILVLDTQGVNVWCAAGKGTFGTDEVVRRLEATRLAEVVEHRRLILPQLGAPGVAAHEVKRRCGFRVVYGPVRAEDIPAFLVAGQEATPGMRRVRFDLRDRLAVTPVELVQGAPKVVFLMACLFLLGGLGPGGYASATALQHGSRAALLLLAAFLGGAFVTPLLLPWLPGRAFSIKGAVVGLLLVVAALGLGLLPREGLGARLELGAWLLFVPALTAFAAMNFTGASTFTSLSGVRREMRFALPFQATCAALGLLLWLAARFLPMS